MRAAIVGLLILAPAVGHAQSAVPTAAGPARVARTSETIVLNGVLEEPAWFTADSITDFTQTDPDEGHPATERTVVRLLATDRGLYVGLWAYDSAAGAIRRAQLRRDADFDSDDSFTNPARPAQRPPVRLSLRSEPERRALRRRGAQLRAH